MLWLYLYFVDGLPPRGTLLLFSLLDATNTVKYDTGSSNYMSQQNNSLHSIYPKNSECLTNVSSFIIPGCDRG